MNAALMVRIALTTLLTAASFACHGAITCTFSSTGWSAAYVPSTAATNITQSSITVTCQRNAGGDGTAVNFTISANNGLHATGTQNRAQLNAANLLNYDDYQNAGCSTL
ncbi:MAG TPA: spore coat protein U domain-containing protein [Usitatibacter sp.]|jgi:spore coat protein U-like protein